jgi:hypothetical protein
VNEIGTEAQEENGMYCSAFTYLFLYVPATPGMLPAYCINSIFTDWLLLAASRLSC